MVAHCNSSNFVDHMLFETVTRAHAGVAAVPVLDHHTGPTRAGEGLQDRWVSRRVQRALYNKSMCNAEDRCIGQGR
jgi:hypothetical protein